MRALALLTASTSLAFALTSPARAADAPAPLRRFAVVAGASLGGPGRTPLRYATSDARDVSRVLRRLGGVAMDDLVLLEEPDADELRATLATVGRATERARAEGRRVELFLYYSGHSDEEALLLGKSRLPYAELRRELDRVPADVRVAILDSCASGAFTRAKGGTHRAPFLLDESSKLSGHAFLTSSAAHEAAQESDRLRASFFTHALLTGLRGAADASGDGVVTLNEAYQFAFRETLAGTEASQAGPQHATYDIGLVGSGDVVMTDLRRADAVLVVPEPIDGKLFVRNASGQLVAELRKVRGARVELALEEGRYAVQVTKERRVLGGSFELVASRRTIVEEGRLSAVTTETTASRGEVRGGVSGEEEAASARADDTTYRLIVRGGPQMSMRARSPRGIDAELAAEAWYLGFVGFEVASGYRRTKGTTEGGLPGQWVAGSVVSDDITVIPATLTLKLGFPAGRAQPYLLGGAGAYWVDIVRRPAREYPWLWQGDRRLADRNVALAGHVGAGANIRISSSWSGVFDVRYTIGRAEVLQENLTLNALRVSAGLGYSF